MYFLNREATVLLYFYKLFLFKNVCFVAKFQKQHHVKFKCKYVILKLWGVSTNVKEMSTSEKCRCLISSSIQCRNDIEEGVSADLALNRLLEEKILSKCEMEAGVSVISGSKFRSYNDLTWTPHRKSTWRVHRYFIQF